MHNLIFLTILSVYLVPFYYIFHKIAFFWEVLKTLLLTIHEQRIEIYQLAQSHQAVSMAEGFGMRKQKRNRQCEWG